MSSLDLSATIASGDSLDVRQFLVSSEMSGLFEATVLALSDNADIDFEAVAGQPATLTLRWGLAGARTISGIVRTFRQVHAEDRGASTYQWTIVPTLWLTTQRRNHRMFQLMSEVDIALKILGEWGISPVMKLTDTYKKRKYRVQYGESDFEFVCRMLEEVGISFTFDWEADCNMVLTDAPHGGSARAPLPFRDNPTTSDREHATAMRLERNVRPGKMTIRDHDYRRPASYKLLGSASGGGGIEEKLERFHYEPGAFLFESGKGESTPFADDKGKYRIDEEQGRALAEKRLAGKRAAAKVLHFETSAFDPGPGTVVTFLDHPKSELAPGKRYLVVASEMRGTRNAEWSHLCRSVSADVPYRPDLVTPKPVARGVESATVVGPPGEEIHVDEFGRVRVHFHWDRESAMDDKSSCWIHVSQPWGGTGFGGTNLPRVGQEVIVDFLGGDPDRPVVVGRVYTNLQRTPYKLPDNKTQSGWQSRSSPGGGGDNYNEIMFEDKKGQELVRMQAEKDLNKLVKHDEEVKIGHDRTKLVVHDDKHTVGHDRTRLVGNDEAVTIGHDRTRQVGHDEDVMIGNNRSKTIGVNETLTVGHNQQETIGHNRSVEVGSVHDETIGKIMNVKVGLMMNTAVGLTLTETVGIASMENVGFAKTTEVGGTYKIGVKAGMDTTVGGNRSTTIGGNLTETVAGSKLVAVGEVFEVTCGPSKIHLDKDGNAVIEATKITLKATGPIGIESGAEMKIKAGGEITVNGSSISMNG